MRAEGRNLLNRASHVTLRIAASLLATWTFAAASAPYIPTDDAQVLERLPGRGTAQFRELKSLQTAAAEAPNDPVRASALATAYI